MNNPLPCAVVRDLLPSYIEGLTEEETNAAVAAHLAACPDCGAKYAAMTTPQRAEETAETEKEVDFLKTVRRRNRKRVLLAMVLVLALTLGGVAAKAFLIGSPLQAGDFALTDCGMVNGRPCLRLDSPDSGTAFFGSKLEEKDGVLTLTARKALVSPFHKSGSIYLELPMDWAEIDQLWLAGQLYYQDGLWLTEKSHALFQARIPYVGNAPGVSHLLSLLFADFPVQYRLSLQTQQEPYGINLDFSQALSSRAEQGLYQRLYLLLALVDNVGYIQWSDGGASHHTLTLEQADATLPALAETTVRDGGPDWPVMDSVKDYSADVWSIAQLRCLLEYGFFDPSTLAMLN